MRVETERLSSAAPARVARPRSTGFRGLLVFAILFAGVLGGCDIKKPKEKASDLLQQGLQAHVAGDTKTARSKYNEVLKLDPNNKFALYDLGLLDQQSGALDSAERRYRQVLQIDPDFSAALFNLAIIRTGPAPQEALDLYRHVISLDPNNGGAHLNLGFVLISLGREAEGREELARAAQLNPEFASRIPSPSPSPSPPKSPSPSPTATR